MKKRIIIGIHGLGNKPPKRVLQAWWKKSIEDGLSRIGDTNTQFKFELVYWANILHTEALDPKIREENHTLYLDEPYNPMHEDFEEIKKGNWKQKLLNKVESKLDKIFFEEDSFINFDRIADLIMRKFFKDLYVYYYDDEKSNKIDASGPKHVRAIIRNKLATVLRRYKKYKILLIAHSMGTIISYDVLTQSAAEINIEILITLGSPLGLPVIIKKILKEQKIDYKVDNRPTTPENIKKHWFNFSDPGDRISINYTLADDYKPNSSGSAPVDYLVDNDYEYKNKKNPHKAFGYLRTPEVATVISEFLKPDQERIFYIIKNKMVLFLVKCRKIVQFWK